MRGGMAEKTKEAILETAAHLRRASENSLGDISQELMSMAQVLERAGGESCPPGDGESRSVKHADIDGVLDQMLTSVATVTPEELGGCRKLELLVSIGSLYESTGKLENAFDCYLGALTASKREMSPHDKAETELKAGRVLCSLAEWSGAERYLKSSLESFEFCRERPGAVRALTLLGRIYYQQGRYHAAKKYIDEGIAIAKQVGDERAIAGLCNIMGLTFSLAGQQGNSLCSFQDALISYQRIYDYRGVAEVYHNIARVHVRQSRITDAAASCDKSLIMCEQTSNLSLLPFVLLTKAEIAWENEDYLACASFCRRSMELLVGWGGPLVIAKVNRILGDLIARVMSWEYAEPFYRHSGEIYRAHDIKAGDAWIHMASARSLEEEGIHSECLAHLEAALQIYRELEFERDATRVAEKIAAMKDLVPTG
jgi:tetratricopeptide (TPR) repeat protein